MTDPARQPRQGFNLSAIRDQIQSLSSTIQSKIDERRRLTQQIEAIHGAPPDRQAVVALLHSHVDELAATYPPALRRQIEPFLANPAKGEFIKKHVLSLLQTSTKPMVTEVGVPAPPTGIFYLLSEPIKAALAAAVDQMELPPGLPSDQRREQLDALQARLAVVDSELRELFDAAAGLGIALPTEALSATEKETRRKLAAAAARAAQEPAMTEIPELPGDEPGAKPPRTTAYEV